MDGFLSLLSLLFDGLNCDVLALFPVDFIAETSFDLFAFKFELLIQSSICEPFVLSKCEDKFQVVLTLLYGSDSLQELQESFVNFLYFLAGHVGLNENLKPKLIKFFIFVVVVLGLVLLIIKNVLSFEVGVGIVVFTRDDVIYLFDKVGVSFSLLDFNLGDFRAHLFVKFALLQHVGVDGNGFNFLFESWKFFDFILNLLLHFKLFFRL